MAETAISSKPKPGPPAALPADCFQVPKAPWEYVFPVDISQTTKLGCPVIQFEPVYRRGRIRELYITYMQTPNHGRTYQIDCAGADQIWFLDVAPGYGPRMGWCRFHKTAYLSVPLPRVTQFRVSVHSSITVWLGEKPGMEAARA